MLKIPNYKLRLECLEYIAEITALQIEIESAVQVYKKSVDEVVDCQGLKETLLVMLECANAMKSKKGVVQKQNTGSEGMDRRWAVGTHRDTLTSKMTESGVYGAKTVQNPFFFI